MQQDERNKKREAISPKKMRQLQKQDEERPEWLRQKKYT